MSLGLLVASYIVVKGKFKALAKEHFPGRQCYEHSLVPQYRIRAAKTYHTGCISRFEDTVVAFWTQLKELEARIMSRTFSLRLVLERLSFAVDPLKDLYLAMRWSDAHPLWGGLILSFTLLPYVGLSLFWGRRKIKRVAAELDSCLQSTVGEGNLLWCFVLPFVDLGFLFQYFHKQPESNVLMHYWTARKLAETFFEANGQLLVQGLLLAWEVDHFRVLSKAGTAEINGPQFFLSVVWSLYSSWSGLEKLKKFASWQTGGNRRQFLKRMRQLGEGLAPSSLLEALHTSYEVDITPAMLQDLDLYGFASVVRATASSKALKRLRMAAEPWDRLLRESEVTPKNLLLDMVIHGMESLETLTFTGPVSNDLASWLRRCHSEGGTHITAALTFEEGGEPVTLRHGAPPSVEEWRASLLTSEAPALDGHFPESSTDALPIVLSFLRTGREAAGRAQDLLWFHATHGHAEPVQALLDFQAEPWANRNGSFVLSKAAQNGDAECVRALLEAKAEPRQANENDGDFPLLIAAQKGHAECVRALLEAKAEPQQANENDGDFPLLIAGHAECVRALLEAKAEPRQANENDGAFPLLIAAQNGHAECVRALLEAKAEPRQANENNGAFPLFMAAGNGHAECVRALLEAKAEPRQAENNGVFPLLIAADLGRTECMRALLDARADPAQRHEEYGVPLQLATFEGHTDAIRLLEEAARERSVHIS